MVKKQTKVRVQQHKNKQYTITVPEDIAMNWLNVKKGDRVEYKMERGLITLNKVNE